MTAIWISAFCSLLFSAIFIASVLVENTIRRWKMLPDFYRKRSGDVVVYCAAHDRDRALLNTFDGAYYVVRGSISFELPNAKDGRFKDKRSGKACIGYHYRVLGQDNRKIWNFAEEDSKLIVPFVDEDYIPFAEQEKIFQAPEDPEKWLLRKQKELLESSFRRRITAKFDRGFNWLYWVSSISVFCAVISLFSSFVLFVNKRDRERKNTPVSEYTLSSDGKVNTHTAKPKETVFLFDFEFQEVLFKGSVTGSISDSLHYHTCVQTKNDVRCGHSDNSFDSGSTAYVRLSRTVFSADQMLKNISYEISQEVISESEAQALLAASPQKFILK